MGLSNSDQEKIKSKLDSQYFQPCSVCGQKSWNIENEIAMLPMFDKEHKMPIEGQIYPLILVSCVNCSNTLTFNAKGLGII